MELFTPLQYLMIDISNNFGNDKMDWDDRLDWFQKNENQLDKLVEQAETPALFYAGIKAYRDVKAGRATGYPISLDATASGIQVLACLTGDRKAAEAVNLIDTGSRRDVYTDAYKHMKETCGATADISRAHLKEAIMTGFYGSTAVPERVFGTGELLGKFYETMEEIAPGPWELNQAFLDMWNPDAYEYTWEMPDGFTVVTKVMSSIKDTVHFMGGPVEVVRKVNAPTKSGRSLSANCTHAVDSLVVREVTRRCDHDPEQIKEVRAILENAVIGAKKLTSEKDRQLVRLWNLYLKSGFLSARIIDYITPKNVGHVDASMVLALLDTFPAKRFHVLAIHDAYRVHCNNGDALRIQYNTVMAQIASSTMLEHMIQQITGKNISITKLDGNMASDILEANYALS